MPQDGIINMPPGSMSGSDGSSTPSSMDMAMQMNFYWGKDVVVFFSGWPGNSLGMYILALCVVFVLGFGVEVLSVSPQLRGEKMISLLLQACVYAVRMGLAYMVMLSVMSYNLGLFIVAIAGHTAGFLLVKARALAAANRAVPMSSAPNDSKV
ncbi:copper transporter 6-like [Mangifera indica]|uniref:copper transporter 6-like n=1 Tax=Mangifera indica TaxID=29780 RepID=UPI001CFAC890|nr:copper transporter 6-like [Mangifera indica]